MPTTLIIPRAHGTETSPGTIPLENVCSRLPVMRVDGASLSLAELRRDVHSRIYESVAHIRELIALEDEVLG